MYSIKTLEISGYRGEPVPNTFFQQDQETHHIAILLPGIGYTCQMPLFYYPTLFLHNIGADVLWVEYAYNKRPDFHTLSDAEQMHWLFNDVTAACDTVLKQHNYQRITIIGKSLGTLAMGHLLTTDAKFAHVQAIWLTPLLWNDRLREQIQQYGQPSLFVIGTADSCYNPQYLADVQAATKGESVVIEGADHGMLVNGDVLQSLKAMERIMRAIEAFVKTA